MGSGVTARARSPHEGQEARSCARGLAVAILEEKPTLKEDAGGLFFQERSRAP